MVGSRNKRKSKMKRTNQEAMMREVIWLIGQMDGGVGGGLGYEKGEKVGWERFGRGEVSTNCT